MTKQYDASPTIGKLLLTFTKYKVNLVLGPIGGGKTVGMIITFLTLMNQQQPDERGRRRTRFAVVRNTRAQLKDSVIKSVFDWIPPNGSSIIWKDTDMTLLVAYGLADGTTVHSEWAFRSLDNEDDARKLLSVEYTAGWISEFREIPKQLLTDLRSRTGRFPSMSDGGATWSGIIGESNMPVEGSDWHQLIEVERPSWLQCLKQPPAMIPDPGRVDKYMVNPLAENIRWLVPNYYEDLMEGSSPYWQQSQILVQYPPSLDGKAVYGTTFKRKHHVAEESLVTFQFGDFSPTLLVGLDQGRNPAAVVAQKQPKGTLFALAELMGENMGMDRFCDEHLLPLLAQPRFIGVPVICVLDPAGFAKGQANDISPADVLISRGFKVIPAPTNAIGRRIEAVERTLQRIDGLSIDPSCVELIRGLTSEYRYRTKKNGELEDSPEKKHPVSDIQDAFQYVCLIDGGVNYGRVLNSRPTAGRVQVAPSRRAWT